MKEHLDHQPRFLLGTLMVLCVALLLLGCQESANPVAPELDDETLVSASKKGDKPGGDPIWVNAYPAPAGEGYVAAPFYSFCDGLSLGTNHSALWNRDWEDPPPVGDDCVVVEPLDSEIALGRVVIHLMGRGQEFTKFQLLVRREMPDGTWEHYGTKETDLYEPQRASVPEWTLKLRQDNVELWRIQGSGVQLKGKIKYIGEPVGTLSFWDVVYSATSPW